MNSTAYKSVRSQSIPSPFQSMRRNTASAFDIQDKKNPVRKELLKTIGSYNFTAEIREDLQAISLFKRKGLIAFVCDLKRDNGVSGFELCGQGRGVAIVDYSNRYFVKAIQAAASAALVDSVVKSTKLLSIGMEVTTPDKAVPESDIGEAYQSTEKDGFEPATEKQRDYLQQLIQINVEDDAEKDRLISQIEELSREEASTSIQAFTNAR